MSDAIIVLGREGAILVPDQAPGWWERHEGENQASVGLGQAPFPANTPTIAQAVNPFGIEAGDAFTHGLGMTVKFRRDRRGPQTRPTAQDDASAEDQSAGA